MSEALKVVKPQAEKKEPKQFAIFEHRNQQYKVKVGDVIETAFDRSMTIEKPLLFEKVLVYNEKIGTPYLKGCRIHGTCLEKGGKHKKIIVFKYKAKKNYRVKTGFRARYNRVRIDKIEG